MATRQKTNSRKSISSPLSYIVLGIIIGLALAAVGAYYMRSTDSTPAKKQALPLPSPTPAQAPSPVHPPLSIAQQTAPSITADTKHDQIGTIIGQIKQPTTATPLASSTPVPPTPVKPSAKATSIAPPKPSSSKPTSPAVAHYLQVGAFLNRAEADTKRGELILQGFERVHIVKVMIHHTEYHRVYLGPFTSEKTLKETQTRLKEKNIKATITR